MRFLFPIFKICAIVALGSPKGRERGRKRGRHGLRAMQARLSPCGEALRRRIFARPRALAPAAEGRVGEMLAIRIRPQALEKPRFAEERSLEFAFPGFDFTF